MKGTKPGIHMLCIWVFIIGAMLTEASLLHQPAVNAISSDQTETPNKQKLAILTKRIDELERVCRDDVNELNKRIQELSESRENDVLEITRLNQEVEELKRFRAKDSQRISLLSQRVKESSRHNENIEEADYFNLKRAQIPDDDETTPYNTSDTMMSSPAAPAPDDASTNENEVPTYLADATNSVRGQGRINFGLDRKVRATRLTENIVAFHAILRDPISSPSLGQAVVFDDIITRSGGAEYNNNTGVFTCKQSGIYVFSWSVSVWGHQFIYTNLERNSDIIGSVQVGQATTWDSASSATVATYLEVGDSVSVRIASHLTGSDVYPLCTMFTGFRLQ